MRVRREKVAIWTPSHSHEQQRHHLNTGPKTQKAAECGKDDISVSKVIGMLPHNTGEMGKARMRMGHQMKA